MPLLWKPQQATAIAILNNAPGNVDVYDKEIKAKAVPIKEIVWNIQCYFHKSMTGARSIFTTRTFRILQFVVQSEKFCDHVINALLWLKDRQVKQKIIQYIFSNHSTCYCGKLKKIVSSVAFV